MFADPSRRRGVIAFIVICFTWSWLSLAVCYLVGVPQSNPVAQLLTMAFVPAVTAVIVRTAITREGFADAGLKPQFRTTWFYYLCAIVLPLASFSLYLFLAYLLGWWETAGDITGHRILQIVATGGLSALPAAFLLFGEEFGWTAYLRDRLLPGRTTATTFLTGVIWGIWHMPLPWVGYSPTDLNTTEKLWLSLMWIPSCILIEFLIGWLWNHSGSIWPSCILHASLNLVQGVGFTTLFLGAAPLISLMVLDCVTLVPFVVLVIYLDRRSKNSARKTAIVHFRE
ncbi:MAG: CPBP family intramembrane metalloprotease [Corynebacterium sp.]|uniref:CPBP family intramembrane glutamic endopeptidase n=1 Tax=Corynebacterium sp. TaxID=1720 RepID=UPI0026DC14EA|nr:CPBP family intramembrane glutamic endopeptidase [Corynebacterium sp.]MDO5099109.1 CPBP family intramembrane metalloprotease [Corynebacterium sp.]